MMLPLLASPKSHNKRIQDWIVSSSEKAGYVQKQRKSQRLTAKRPLEDENTSPLSQVIEPMVKKMKTTVISDPLNASHSKVIEPPSTPESKTSNSLSCSPASKHWMSEITIRRHGNQVSKTVISDSESAQSTPVKPAPATPVKQAPPATPDQRNLTVTCGIVSPAESNEMVQPNSSGKKFFQSGQRRSVNGKTPLDYYKEIMKQSKSRIHSTKKKVKRQLSVTPKPPNTVRFNSTPRVNTYNPETSITRESPTYCGHLPFAEEKEEMTTPKEREVEDAMDMENTTLVAESRTKKAQKVPLFKQGTSAATGDQKDQLVIDAGQSNLDETYQCPLCRMVYTKRDPTDEACHRRFHGQLVSALKFPGWKKEYVVEEGEDFRILSVNSGAAPHEIKKVQALKVILDQELGFVQETSLLTPGRRVYIYISDKHVQGVCVAEGIKVASKFLGETASRELCYASIGINRIWVAAQHRRKGIATKLLDVIRSTFALGSCVSRGEIAFSDPTTFGKKFAEKYAGTSQFLVYRP